MSQGANYLTVPVCEALPTASADFRHQVRVLRASPSAASTLHICRYNGSAWEWVELTLIDDATLVALAAYNTNGLIAQTAADTFAGRTITGTANEVAVANGDGVSGNPTLSLPSAITAPGSLTVTTLLTAAGVSGSGSAPSLADGAALGSGPGSKTITGNDVSGGVVQDAGTSTATGTLWTVTFAVARADNKFHVFLENQNAAVTPDMDNLYVTTKSTDGFVIGTREAPTSEGGLAVSWLVVGYP